MAQNKKMLYRSLKNKNIAGVCGGFAEYLDQDPTLVRLLFILILLVTAVIPGIIFYIIAWMIMPER